MRFGCTISQVTRFDTIFIGWYTFSLLGSSKIFFQTFFFRFFSKNGCIFFVRSQPFPAECHSSTAIKRPLSSSSVTHETFAHPTAVIQIIEILNIGDGLEAKLQSTFFVAIRFLDIVAVLA